MKFTYLYSRELDKVRNQKANSKFFHVQNQKASLGHLKKEKVEENIKNKIIVKIKGKIYTQKRIYYDKLE